MWRYKEAEGRKDEDPKCIVSQKGLEAVDRGYCLGALGLLAQIPQSK